MNLENGKKSKDLTWSKEDSRWAMEMPSVSISCFQNWFDKYSCGMPVENPALGKEMEGPFNAFLDFFKPNFLWCE